MIVFYGWGKDLKPVAYAGIEKCPRCKNWAQFSVYEQTSHASLYFIKVARWGKKLYYRCETCKGGWEIEEQAKEDAIKRTIGLPPAEQLVQMWAHLDTSAANAITAGSGSDRLPELLGLALTNAVEQLKTEHQPDHVAYIANRYVAYLRDTDRPR
jgi:zinc-ribbon family